MQVSFVALALIAVGVGLIILGYKLNSPGQRSLGVKIFIVGAVLFLFSTFTDISVFPTS